MSEGRTSLDEGCELTPGRRYRIYFNDCCIEGEAEGVYLGLRPFDDGSGWDGILFDFGYLNGSGGIDYVELFDDEN